MTTAESFESLYQIINDNVDVFVNISRSRLPANMAFIHCVKATTVKCYEYIVSICSADEIDSYMVISTLRGLCEDLIFLKFLNENARDIADKITGNLAMHEVCVSSIAQWKFFKYESKDQTLYYDEGMERSLKFIEEQNANLFKSIGIDTRGKVKPSIYTLAKKTGFYYLYDYLYHGTSSLVHFNPRNLLRMGWDNSILTFSSCKFHSYYKEFGMFYGSYILIKILSLYEEVLSDVEVGKVMAKLKDFTSSRDNWPPLVTFQEMNIKASIQATAFKSPMDT